MIRAITLLMSLILMGNLAFSQDSATSTAETAQLPIDVSADSLTVDQESRMATFKGNASVLQGQMALYADEIAVTYSEEDGEINNITAVGNIRFTRPEGQGRAERATYDVASQNLILNENVELRQGATLITGDQLTYDVRSNNAQMTGNVRTKFTPK